MIPFKKITKLIFFDFDNLADRPDNFSDSAFLRLKKSSDIAGAFLRSIICMSACRALFYATENSLYADHIFSLWIGIILFSILFVYLFSSLFWYTVSVFSPTIVLQKGLPGQILRDLQDPRISGEEKTALIKEFILRGVLNFTILIVLVYSVWSISGLIITASEILGI